MCRARAVLAARPRPSPCATSLEALGWTTNTLDATWLGGHGHGWGSAAEAGVRRILTIPGLHDAFHFAALRTGNQLALQADAVTRVRLVPHLRDYLDRHPVELVMSLSPAGASAVSTVAPRYPSMRHVVFCTEASPHRLWIHPNVDLYLVRSPAAEPAVHRFRPTRACSLSRRPCALSSTGRPLSARRGSASACARQGRCVLLVAGSRGQGPLADIAEALAEAGLNVLAVAGHNAGLSASCAMSQRRRPNVHVFGFTDRMPELMAAADLVITIPGGTCMEARTVGRPLLLLDLVQGHGRDDLLYELELGDASVTSKRPSDVVRSALACLERIKPAPPGRPGRWPTGRTGSVSRWRRSCPDQHVARREDGCWLARHCR